MCSKAGDPALRSNPPPPYKRRGRGITLVSFYSQKNQSSTGEKKTRRMHSIARLQTTEARTRTISFPPPSPSFSVPAFSNSNTSPSSSPAFLFFSFFFLFCFLSISVERPRFSWSREHVARAQFAFSWPTTGCPLFTTPSLPGPRLSTMYTQSCSSHQKAAETSTSLGVSRENVRNFRTCSASYPIFVPPSLSFFFLLCFAVEFLFLDRFLAFGFDRISISLESAWKQIFGGQRNCRGIQPRFGKQLVFASTNFRCVRASSRVDSQRDNDIWPDFASSRKDL